ncbi:GNAT family N-acetyltransferase [Ureibacillus chungkukjangi]|uniref:Acetoin utilization protein AcuA n=1 Tax=Ureibacillus chungkukjangi TaxID=1202712 RepID=A0A318U1G2_9BACL|nr:GNAT family N-acetyltransferase [Ureibacillus chungkukjangi]MCM3387442.1 GNAT family N-acetyltransferase [Ureibacillus chungkukjangi]PYF09078.1 acetoin utilization protein AcuA [Ureibacillus chungkukjangi]
MKHIKTFYSMEMETRHGQVIIEGPVPPEQLEKYTFHDDLVSFRPPLKQQKALVEIAKLDEGRIVIIRNGETVVGYVTYLYPDPLERWSEDQIENMIELGAIEVIPSYRSGGVAKKLLQLSFMDEAMENYLVITTEYYWHWDLKGTGLNVWDYRKMMERLMQSVDFVYFATDDPEITSHPANCLMARVGKRVNNDTMERFDRLRFKNRFMY